MNMREGVNMNMREGVFTLDYHWDDSTYCDTVPYCSLSY